MHSAGLDAVRITERGHLRLEALAPQPHLVGGQAEPGNDLARRVHQRLQLRRGRAGRPHGGLVAEVVRRRALGVGPVRRRHEDVAVLHARMEDDLVAAQLRLQRGDHLGRRLRRRMSAGEVEHRAVVADGHEVAAIRHLVGPQLQPEGRRLDRRATGVVRRRVVADDRHVADVGPRAEARSGSPRPARPRRAASADSVGIDAASSGVRPPSASIGSSAQPSGTHTTYFTGRESAWRDRLSTTD